MMGFALAGVPCADEPCAVVATWAVHVAHILLAA